MTEDVNVSRCMFYFLTALDGSLVNPLLMRTIKVLSHYGLRTRFWQFVRTWFC